MAARKLHVPLEEIDLNIDLREPSMSNEENSSMLDLNAEASEFIVFDHNQNSSSINASSSNHRPFDLNIESLLEEDVHHLEHNDSSLEGGMHVEELLLEDDTQQHENNDLQGKMHVELGLIHY